MNKKIYFAGAIRGGIVDAEVYKRMIDYIKMTDTVLTEHIGKSNETSAKPHIDSEIINITH